MSRNGNHNRKIYECVKIPVQIIEIEKFLPPKKGEICLVPRRLSYYANQPGVFRLPMVPCTLRSVEETGSLFSIRHSSEDNRLVGHSVCRHRTNRSLVLVYTYDIDNNYMLFC